MGKGKRKRNKYVSKGTGGADRSITKAIRRERDAYSVWKGKRDAWKQGRHVTLTIEGDDGRMKRVKATEVWGRPDDPKSKFPSW